MHKYVFTDTNLFEQYQPITDIDWLALANCASVSLLVPSVTIRELNDHKDGATRGRLKRKASAALIQLKRYSDVGTPAKIREGVYLDFRPREPLIDFGMHHLDAKLNDDRLLASAIELAIEKQLGPQSVLVATGDFGLELKIKSQSLIAPLRLPDTVRLPNELDQEETRIKDLENEVRRLRGSIPQLSLTFKTGETFIETALEPPLELQEQKVQDQLAQLRCKYPLLDATPATPETPLTVFSALVNTPQRIAEYNKALATYYENVEGYYHATLQFLNRQRLSIPLSFVLNNAGGAPAEDIDVELHFPDGFSVLEAGDAEIEPEKPKPPLRPAERLSEMAAFPNIRMPELNFPTLAPRRFVNNAVANTRLTGIKKTNSYKVTFSVKKLKHTVSEDLPPIRIRFDSFEEVKSFSIEYRILAGNLPTPVTGNLHVKVSVS
jgi:hypothetical protein